MTRSLVAIAAFAAVLATAPGCKRRRHAAAASEGPMSVLQMADPRVEPQLVKGLYTVEQGAWRWTAKDFTFKLKTPAGAANKGAMLDFKFTIPDVVLTRVGPSITLSCSVNGTPLAPQTYAAAGEQMYTRDVPASALANDPATVEFKLDKAMPPAGGDIRELGVVSTLVGLEPKP